MVLRRPVTLVVSVVALVAMGRLQKLLRSMVQKIFVCGARKSTKGLPQQIAEWQIMDD